MVKTSRIQVLQFLLKSVDMNFKDFLNYETLSVAKGYSGICSLKK